MKEIKFLLIILASALYTSLWWIAAIYGPGHNGTLYLLPVLATVPVVAVAVMYCAKNWKDDK